MSPGGPLSSHSSGVPSEAPTSAAATKGTSNAPDQDMLRLEDADATVETLLLMEYADLGTLDQTVTSGKLKGDLVSPSMTSLLFLILWTWRLDNACQPALCMLPGRILAHGSAQWMSCGHGPMDVSTEFSIDALAAVRSCRSCCAWWTLLRA